MLPETGNDSDFKRAVLCSVDPVPRYTKQPWRISASRWPIYLNGWLAVNNFREIAIDLYFGVWDHSATGAVIAAPIQCALIWFVIWSHGHAEQRNENTFYKVLEFVKKPDPDSACALVTSSAYQAMANMIRRSQRKPSSDRRVWWYNKLHVETRKCKCCLMIMPGFRTCTERTTLSLTDYVFPEKCPFCNWEWTI